MTADDDDARLLLAKGDRAWSAGRVDEAIQSYQTLAERFPDQPEGYNKLGVVHAGTHDLERASDYFLRALECDRTHVASLSNLGNIYLERGDASTAIWYYSRALETDPEYAPAHHNMAVAYRKQGNLRDFVRHLKQAQRYERSPHAMTNPSRPRDPFFRLGRRLTGIRLWWVLLALAALVVLPRVLR